MQTEAVLSTLRRHEPELRRMGVRHAALFGSLARGEATPESDIDLMVELDPGARLGVYEYVGIVLYLRDLFPGKVDVANREGLHFHVREDAERDAIFAF